MKWKMKRLPWLLLLVVVMVSMETERADAQLRTDFYKSSCPNVEAIVKQAVQDKLKKTVVTIPATLRVFFHDCIIQGCDASVMIANARGDAEKDAPDNLSLPGDGFDTVIQAKKAVEAQCPGVVSCADILAIAARDVVVLAGGPNFPVELGRRDGLTSQASVVAGHLPSPDSDLDGLISFFREHQLTAKDMAALSGAHTIGFSHCAPVFGRIYDFKNTPGAVDPTMDPAFVAEIQRVCPRNVDPTIAINMDINTPLVFDNVYYKNLAAGRGLFTSDQVLFTDTRSRPTVELFAANQTEFFQAFVVAMVRLGRFGVKTGTEGEIRRDCTTFN
ncbi:peroxidase 51-like isoform X2 [Curcuma longa]|uniref:peroxidase 51-like isoform X2 n=1 Tax=Curcuma longa TaxID=136217 RepID=UPI003D9EDD23